jgi:hypothetical protein
MYVVLVALLLTGVAAESAWAGEFKLMDGTTIYGDVSAFDEDGVVFRLRTGGFSERYSWSKFSQDALKELAMDPKAQAYAEPFIEIPPDERPRPQPKPVVLKEVNRVELPAGRTTFFSSFTAPMGLLILGVLYAANLLAAFEIARYRNRPVAVVCGLSALLPLIGPLIFLASPTLEAHADDTATEPLEVDEPGPAVAATGSPAAGTSRSLGKVGVPPPMSGTGLKVAAAAKGAAEARGETRVFKRGDYTFNRRFIETQFSGFFRIVPSEAEKDMVLVVKTPKQDYIARRISRISAADMFIQPVQAAAKEISVSFGEIAEIQIRHKDEVGR